MLTKEEYKSINEKFIKNSNKQNAIKVFSLIIMMVILLALIFLLLYFVFDFFSITLLIIVVLVCAIFTYLPSVILIFNWKINKYLIQDELEKALHYSKLFSKLTFNLFKEAAIATDICIHFAMNDEKFFEGNIYKISPNSLALVDTYFYQSLYNLKHKNFKEAIDKCNLLSLDIEQNEPHCIQYDALLEAFKYAKTNEKTDKLVNYQEVFNDAYFNNVIDVISTYTIQDNEELKNSGELNII